MCYLEAVSRRISVPLVSLKLHRQICRAETYFEGLSSDEQLGFIFKQVALKCSLKRTTNQHNVKYIPPNALFSSYYITPEQLFKALIKILTLVFISVCPHCHSQWINSLGKRDFSPLLCCLGWVWITELICFAWSSQSEGKKQLSSQWRDALPVELWNPHKQAG